MKTIRIAQLMQDSGVVFGTSGTRGLVAQMSDELCLAYTSAFIAVLRHSFRFSRVALGIDLRPSSPKLPRPVRQGLRRQV